MIDKFNDYFLLPQNSSFSITELAISECDIIYGTFWGISNNICNHLQNKIMWVFFLFCFFLSVIYIVIIKKNLFFKH